MPISLFLTTREKQDIRDWKYQVDDQSISTQLLTPVWDYLLTWIPDHVAPNVITLAGFLCLLHAYYLTYNYYQLWPTMIALINAVLLLAYQTLDALDGKHARVTRNSSPVGELFDHCCDQVGLVFIVLTMTHMFGLSLYDGDPRNIRINWFLLNLAQLVFMGHHLEALRQQTLHFNRWTGPGEALLVCVAVCLIPLTGLVNSTSLGGFLMQHSTSTELCLITVYLGLTGTLALEASRHSYSTRNGVWFCLGYRAIEAVLFYHITSSTVTTLADSFFWCMVTADLILAKMARRDLHPMIVVGAMVSVLSSPLSLAMTAVYYFALFYDLCQDLNLSMFTINRTVYVDGVYDLFHFGHMNQFKQALQYGNRLVVGVIDDPTYKRTPYMSIEERVQAVKSCRMVSEVIEGVTCQPDHSYLTQKFLDRHNIHVVAHSEEYTDSDSPFYDFYKVPREQGMTQILTRTKGSHLLDTSL